MRDKPPNLSGLTHKIYFSCNAVQCGHSVCGVATMSLRNPRSFHQCLRHFQHVVAHFLQKGKERTEKAYSPTGLTHWLTFCWWELGMWTHLDARAPGTCSPCLDSPFQANTVHHRRETWIFGGKPLTHLCHAIQTTEWWTYLLWEVVSTDVPGSIQTRAKNPFVKLTVWGFLP